MRALKFGDIITLQQNIVQSIYSIDWLFALVMYMNNLDKFYHSIKKQIQFEVERDRASDNLSSLPTFTCRPIMYAVLQITPADWTTNSIGLPQPHRIYKISLILSSHNLHIYLKY